MRSFENISAQQTLSFGNIEKGCFCDFQNVDYQYRYFYNYFSSFTGKEKDPETGYSYFGSRYLDHELTTAWLSVDPMADKYPSLSPYAYCAWNPVKLVDPEGEEIWIKIGSSILENNRIRWTRDGSYYEDGTPYEGGNEFADQTILALNYLYSDEGANIILSKFHGNTEYDIVISETLGITICNVMSCGNDKYGYFPSKKQVIDFNPYIGLAQPTSEDNSQEAYMAPFICLLHEFGHIYNAVSDLKSFNERKATIDEDYDNLEEKTVIQDYEHPVAGRNGMLQRTSHQLDKKGLRLIKTSGSMSSTPINNIEK